MLGREGAQSWSMGSVSPSGSANAAPRYGVVNPYTGAAEVGLLAPVMII